MPEMALLYWSYDWPLTPVLVSTDIEIDPGVATTLLSAAATTLKLLLVPVTAPERPENVMRSPVVAWVITKFPVHVPLTRLIVVGEIVRVESSTVTASLALAIRVPSKVRAVTVAGALAPAVKFAEIVVTL